MELGLGYTRLGTRAEFQKHTEHGPVREWNCHYCYMELELHTNKKKEKRIPQGYTKEKGFTRCGIRDYCPSAGSPTSKQPNTPTSYEGHPVSKNNHCTGSMVRNTGMDSQAKSNHKRRKSAKELWRGLPKHASTLAPMKLNSKQ